MSSITKAEIRELVRNKAKAKAEAKGVSANRLLSFIKRLWRYADKEDIIEVDLARIVEKPRKEKRRDRFLADNEVRLFWQACDKLADPAGRLFRMMLVTGQRRGEVAGLRHSEIGVLEYQADDDKKDRKKTRKLLSAPAWLLAAERTKRRKAHAVPLTPLALRQLKGPSPKWDHAFASGIPSKAEVVCDAENKPVLDDDGNTIPLVDKPPEGFNKWKKQLDKAIGEIMAAEAGEKYDPKKHMLEDWHLHDLRGTCVSHLEKLRVDRRVISRLVNHAEGGTTAGYARYSFDHEAVEAMKLWSDKIERLCGLNVRKMKVTK